MRISNHILEIETGRAKKIPRQLRLCKNCNTLEDDEHFMFHCTCIQLQHKTIVFRKKKHAALPDMLNLQILLSSNEPQLLRDMGLFIKKSFELRKAGLQRA